MDLKQFVNNIMRSNVADLHSDLRELRTKISKTAITLIQTYGGGNLSININKTKGDKIWFENDTLYITQSHYNEEKSYLFEELDLDKQLNILDEIINTYS